MPHRTSDPPTGKTKGKLAKVVPIRPKAKGGKAAAKARVPKRLDEPSSALIEQLFAALAESLAQSGSLVEADRAQLTVVQRVLEPKACFIVRRAPDREILQVVSTRGRNDPRIAAAQPGRGAVGLSFTEKRIVREDGLLAAPLLASGEATGCLVLLNPRYDLGEGLTRALCSQVASAAEVARLRDDAARKAKDLQTAVAGLRALETTREELVANVSHDLKTPLSTIKTYLTMLMQQRPGSEELALGPLSEKQTKAVVTCERNADRLLRMINNLLLLSRLQSGKMQLNDKAFGLKALAEEAIAGLAPLSAATKVRVSLAPSTEAFVRGDQDRMREAISNVIETAVQQCPAEGQVTVKVEARPPHIATLAVDGPAENVQAEELGHLFDIYPPEQAPGAGKKRKKNLGLPIAAKIVHLHGGRIEATRTDSGELGVRMHLSMFAGAVALPEPTAAGARAGGILLVEDDLDCREVLQQVLELEGYRVVAVQSVGEARNFLQTARPALVLLDLRLSEEDGKSVLHFIRGKTDLKDVSVYIISGSRDVASLSAGTGLDRIDGFFEKPLQVAKVLEVVRNLSVQAR